MKVAVYDALEKSPILSRSWARGTKAFKRLTIFDQVVAASSWEGALRIIADLKDEIEEIQFWGHGSPGRAYIGHMALDIRWLRPGHPMSGLLGEVAAHFNEDSLIWFRNCSMLAGAPGREIIATMAELAGCRVAAHTFKIWWYHSGLRSHRPGDTMDWDLDEGIKKGTFEKPLDTKWSDPWAPNTIRAPQWWVPSDW